MVHFARTFPKLALAAERPRSGGFGLDRSVAHRGGVRQPPAAGKRWTRGRLAGQIAAADAVMCINMVHISPWAATVGLMRGAGRLLAAGAPLYLYGAYRQVGRDGAEQ